MMNTTRDVDMEREPPLDHQELYDLVRTLQRNLQASDQATQALRQQVIELQAQRTVVSTPAQRPSVGTPASDDTQHLRGSVDPPHQDSVRYEKARLPDVEVFNDGKHEDYLQWQAKMKAKLYGDRRAYPDEESKVNYVITRTSGKAFLALKSYVSAMISGATTASTGEVWELLDGFFIDPTSRQKALEWLRTTKQGKQDLNYFVQLFNIKLSEAGLETAHDSQKIDYLKNALNLKLLRSQAGYQVDKESYSSFVSRARITWENLQLVDRISSGRPGPITHTAPQHRPIPPAGDPMDWTPTVTGAVQARTNKERWGTPKEIQERRATGSCLKCGEKGHFVRQCKLDNQRGKDPKKNPVRVAAASAQTSSVDELSSSDEDQGKE
jgi:hypothetical protein